MWVAVYSGFIGDECISTPFHIGQIPDFSEKVAIFFAILYIFLGKSGFLGPLNVVRPYSVDFM